MSRTKAIILSAIAASTAFVFVTDAQAQQRRKGDTVVRTQGAPPLTIRQRSFLDSGPIVAPRSMNNYVSMDTTWRQPVYDNQRGRMGLETMPTRFNPPGRPSPLFEF
ncbi:MAG: hypothetical protein K2Y29_20190 [Beijerinckiaceae bacterium]|nr:hypothetical protein [Beijerinckiaceae bacterium]